MWLFGVQGLGLRARGFGPTCLVFWAQGLGFRALDFGLRVYGVGLRALGFRTEGSGDSGLMVYRFFWLGPVFSAFFWKALLARGFTAWGLKFQVGGKGFRVDRSSVSFLDCGHERVRAAEVRWL